jgi:hypothetical protein
MNRLPLSAEQEREAKLLESKIHLAVDQEIANLARLLVSKSEEDLFGATEFQVRDLVLRVGATAFAEHLREKKTATGVVRSIAPTANKAPTFKDTVRCNL